MARMAGGTEGAGGGGGGGAKRAGKYFSFVTKFLETPERTE